MPTNMKIYRIANLAVLSFVLSIAFATAACADDKAVPGWDPAVFRDASTIKVMTTELTSESIGQTCGWSSSTDSCTSGLAIAHTDAFRRTPPALT